MPQWTPSERSEQGERKAMSIQTGAAVVGALAMIYGVGFAILPTWEWSGGARTLYTLGGAALLGLLFLAFVLVPWFIQRD